MKIDHILAPVGWSAGQMMNAVGKSFAGHLKNSLTKILIAHNKEQWLHGYSKELLQSTPPCTNQ